MFVEGDPADGIEVVLDSDESVEELPETVPLDGENQRFDSAVVTQDFVYQGVVGCPFDE